MRYLTLLLAGALCLSAQNLSEFEKKVTEFTLDNGMKFIVVERHEAPVVSFHTYVNAGSANDPEGRTGLAHMFEHMAFKGTETIGTKNWAAEKKALAAVEAAYDRLDAERAKGPKADPQRIKTLAASLQSAIETANSFVVPNEYPRLIEENGGTGLNASTGLDATEYYYSLPSNRIELWYLLESQRFLNPVFREFYKERDVVREERRMRIESSPQGKLVESLLATAFAALPYRNPTAGWAADIDRLRVEDARAFFRNYYVPSNMTIAIVGDVNPAEAKRLAQRYFGRLPNGTLPERTVTPEPEQWGEKRVTVESPAQPFVAMGYKRPTQTHPDDPVFDVLSGVLASGRTGMLYKELVRDKRVALMAATAPVFPGGKYTGLFLFYVMPNSGHTVQEMEKGTFDIIERLKTEKVDQATLDRVKTKVRASVIRQLDSNSGLASQLTWYEVNYGDWRKLFTGIEDIDRVTADDVQRVARQYLVPTTRTVATTVPPLKTGPAPAAPKGGLQ